MPSVFHYTSAAGLLGIISSKCLFATDYRYLNDASEAGIIRDLLLPIFEDEIADITPKLIAKGLLKDQFYKDHGLGGHRLQADAVYNALTSVTDNVSPFFVLSFCKHEETSAQFKHGLLSQWRAYSGAGGFALEFDEEELGRLMKLEYEKYAFAVTKQADVLYDGFERLFQADVYKGIAGSMIRQLYDDDVNDITGKRSLEEAVVELVRTAPFLKNSGFHEEKEYRIMGACLRFSKKKKGEKRLVKEIKFRTRNGLIVPYIELFGGYVLPIKSILVGPHPQQEKQAEAVSMMLEAQGLKLDLRLSAIPYRS